MKSVVQELAINGGTKVRTAPWPKPAQRFGKEELKELKEALAQNTLFYHFGKKTKAMCAKMARMCKSKYVVPCSSGSAAIHGAVKAAGIGPGDEVITTPLTDAGTILGVVYEGAIPVFADIDPESYNITADTLKAQITPRTKAVIIVHLQGNPVDMKSILKLCKPRKIKVIEDCAQAWGAKIDGRWVGTFGDFGCFSLNDFKHIGCGDGGLIVTNNAVCSHRASLAIDKCYDRLKGTRALDFCAPNYRITELQSAVAIAQLDKVKIIVAKRNRLAKRLAAGIAQIRGLTPTKVIKGGYPTWWFYVIGYDEKIFGVDIKTFGKAVVEEGINMGTGCMQPVHVKYPYLRNHTAFNHSKWPFCAAKSVPIYGEGLCPVAERASVNCLNFWIKEWWSEQEIDDSIKAIKKVAAYYHGRKI